MSGSASLERFLLRKLPRHSESIYRFCQGYIDRYNGDNNPDSLSNGEQRFLRSELRGANKAVVFDVGANAGTWARLALAASPDIQLHCFEPGSSAYDDLVKQSWPANVRLNRFALGERDSEAELNVFSYGSRLSSMYARPLLGEPVTAEKIAVRSVDSYCAESGIDRIALLKIDVEGHELSVLRGASRMLSEGRVSTVQFEYGGCSLDARIQLKDLWEFLERFGYSIFKLFPDGPRRMETYGPHLETFKYSNWVARLGR